MSDYAALAQPVGAALRALRPIVLEAFAKPPDPERRKDDGSSITALDTALEELLAASLLALDATFGLRSEEAGWMREGRPTWHLDPLDGTANFERRLPLFASQVALMDGVRPLFGAIYDPLADDLTWAAAGAGAWREGRRLRMPDRPLADARVVLDLAEDGLFMDDPDLVRRVRRSCYRVRALGSAAIHFREIASGVLDAYLGGRATPTPLHDLGPGLLLVREAGGRDSDGHGGDPLVRQRVVVAGSPRVHDGLVALLRPSG
ncbi:MAG: inositol monophosphatase family protein [Planctomycetota bacterium]